jgi:uncharacterized DUF497 family protein
VGCRQGAPKQAGPWHLVRDSPGGVLENYYFEDEGEQRHLAIGMTLDLVLVVVVFVDRSDPLFEVIHIISARKAVAYEQSIYEDQIP